MYKLDKEAFKRYFFYGDENPEGTLEGIMFFTYQNMGEVRGNEEEIIKQFVQEVKPLYKQYYRFVELNNKCNIYNYKRGEEEEELEQRILKKIEQLRNRDEIVTEEEVQAKIWEGTKQRYEVLRKYEGRGDEHVKWSKLRQIDIITNKIEPYPEWWESQEKKEEWVNKRRQEWQEETLNIEKRIREEQEKRRTKRLIIKENELTYSSKARLEYAHIPEGAITKEEHQSCQQYVEYNRTEWGKDEDRRTHQDIHNILRHWTEDIYDILKTLVEIEETDTKAYTNLWLRTRQNRAKNGTIQGISKEEIERINHACERIRRIRLEAEKQEEFEI